MQALLRLLQSFSEFISLFFVNLKFQIFSFFEFIKVAARYYPNRTFRIWDLAILWRYIFKNPYGISKRYLLARQAENPYLYGETPLTAMEKMAKRFHIKASDVFYELGCGRGRTCFWVAAFVKCQVIGVEIIPTFFQIANRIRQKYKIANLNFLCHDILELDYSIATCVYFFGTSAESEFIEKLIDKLSHLPSGARVITVSFPLTDYTKKPLFRVVDRMSLDFGFGEVDAFLQLRL